MGVDAFHVRLHFCVVDTGAVTELLSTTPERCEGSSTRIHVVTCNATAGTILTHAGLRTCCHVIASLVSDILPDRCGERYSTMRACALAVMSSQVSSVTSSQTAVGNDLSSVSSKPASLSLLSPSL